MGGSRFYGKGKTKVISGDTTLVPPYRKRLSSTCC